MITAAMAAFMAACSMGWAEDSGSAKREALIERVKPSVVQIRAKDSRGSGFIVDGIGLIVTNAHVVAQEQAGDTVGVYVFDPASSKWELRTGTVWARGPGVQRRDIAVVRLGGPRRDWPKLDFATAKTLKRGRPVLSLGFPLGDPVFSSKEGTVSAPDHRHRSEFQGYFEHSAVVVPGNSGGPVIGEDGRVLGVNTEVGVDEARVTGISYAIKSDDVLAMLAQLRKQDHIDPASLGARLRDLHFNDGKLSRGAVFVDEVDDAGPAKKAGLQVGDLIVQAGFPEPRPLDDEHPLREFNRLLRSKAPGDRLSLLVERAEDKPVRLDVTLGRMKSP